MNNNIDAIKEWEKVISKYKKLILKEAKQKYIESLSINDIKQKNKYIEELIKGILYIVPDFIKTNGLIYINSPIYDMNDIINVSNQILFNKINSGQLLKIDNFNQLFDSKYYQELLEGLGLTKYNIYENTILDAKNFVDLLFDYIKIKEKNPNFSYKQFLDYINADDKYNNAEYRINYFENNLYFLDIYEGIIKSLNLKENDIDITKTKLNKIKYIIFNNGIEYMREEINKVIIKNIEEEIIDKINKNEIEDFIVQNEFLTTIQKDVILKRFGFYDGQCKTLEEIAKEYGVTRENIRQKEGKALRKLRYSNLKNYY